jgi:hypothetical protein
MDSSASGGSEERARVPRWFWRTAKTNFFSAQFSGAPKEKVRDGEGATTSRRGRVRSPRKLTALRRIQC